MKKEQITFVVVAALLILLAVTGGPDKSSGRRRRGLRRPPPDAQKPMPLMGAFLGTDEITWGSTKRNVFRAPRETTDLPPIELAPPPARPIPSPGLPTVPAIGGEAQRALRHDLIPDPQIELPPAVERLTSDEGEEVAEGEDEGEVGTDPELDTVDTSSVGLTRAQQLRMSVEERLKREARDAERRQAELERRRGLDRVVWLNETIGYGEVLAEKSDADRFALKLEVDRLRADASLSGSERDKALEQIRFVFREDRGPTRAPGRQLLLGNQLQRIEFAPTAKNRYSLRRLRTARTDLDKQLDLAKIVFDAGEMEVAAKHLEEMLERQLESAEVYAMLADAYRVGFYYAREFKTLERGLARYPKSVPLLSRAGQLFYRLQVPGKAEEMFGRALAEEPANALAQLGKGSLKLDAGQGQPAVDHLRQAQSGVGLDAEQKTRARLLLAQAYLLVGDLRNSQQQVDVVLDRDPTHPRGVATSAVIALGKGDAAGALSALERGLVAHPLDGGLVYLKAVCLLRTGEYAAARDQLMTAIELDPLLTGYCRTALSYLMEKVGQSEASLSEADLARSADPLASEVRLQRARALLNVGDLDEARTQYLEVLASDPERPDILVALGDVHFRKNEYAAAMRFFRRAESIEPGFPGLLGRLLVTEVRRRRLTYAEEYLTKIPSNLSRDPYIQAAVAYYHYARGNPQETLHGLRKLKDAKEVAPALRTYSAVTCEAVDDNLSKEVWNDAFDRTGTELLRGWSKNVGAGINIALSDETIQFKGKQKRISDEPTVLVQERSGRQFHSFSIDLLFLEGPQSGVYAGCGIIGFNQNRTGVDRWPGFQERSNRRVPFAGMQIARSPEGKLVYRFLKNFAMSDWEPLPLSEFTGSGRVNVAFVLKHRRKGTFDILVDQKVVLQDFTLPGLGRWPRALELQAFCQATIDRVVDFQVDNASIVTLKR